MVVGQAPPLHTKRGSRSPGRVPVPARNGEQASAYDAERGHMPSPRYARWVGEASLACPDADWLAILAWRAAPARGRASGQPVTIGVVTERCCAARGWLVVRAAQPARA